MEVSESAQEAEMSDEKTVEGEVDEESKEDTAVIDDIESGEPETEGIVVIQYKDLG